ncbi:hypothetical protein [Aquabacterium sp.]|uniref:hypothetical protein n=1 Tax=Aquabacterium sp. TaxID=1872578 RepID=UPI0040379CFF
MFLSDPHFEQRVPPALLPPGGRSWRVVELSLSVPWFIVTLRERADECLRKLMVAYEADLLELIGREKQQILAIHRVSPPRRPHTDWAIEPLQEIWMATSSATRWWQFIDSSGTETCWPKSTPKQHAAVSRQLIMSLPIH